VWTLAQSRGDGYRSLVTPERVSSEYNQNLIFCILDVEDVNLSKNLLSTWSEVCRIAKQLSHLQELNLSDNILSLDDVDTASSAFPSLHTLVLNHCRLTWKEVC